MHVKNKNGYLLSKMDRRGELSFKYPQNKQSQETYVCTRTQVHAQVCISISV